MKKLKDIQIANSKVVLYYTDDTSKSIARHQLVEEINKQSSDLAESIAALELISKEITRLRQIVAKMSDGISKMKGEIGCKDELIGKPDVYEYDEVVARRILEDNPEIFESR